ncbi:MAG: T9SS type A sorting domain-containing protein [Vicingaceae bacterium]
MKSFIYRVVDRIALTSAITASLLVIISTGELHAQSLKMDWLGYFTSSWTVDGRGVVKDSNGNTYVSGDYAFTADFDQGPGKIERTAVGNSDIFLAKFDGTGLLQWTASKGTTGWEHNYDLVLDQFGNPLLSGNMGDEAFLANYNSTGAHLWERRLMGSGFATITSVAVDYQGNIITAGIFSGIIDFDPSNNQFLMDGSVREAFIAKFNPNGHFIWAREVNVDSAQSSTYGESLSVDEHGGIYLMGHGTGHMDLNTDGSAQNFYQSIGINGTDDLFLIKLNKQGKYQWSYGFGSVETDYAVSVSVHGAGVYNTGYVNATVDFDPGPGTDAINTNTLTGYLQKFDTSGNYQWVRRAPGVFMTASRSMMASQDGFVYWCSSFRDQATIPTQNGTVFMKSAGDFDNCLLKVDASGQFIWAEHVHKGLGLERAWDLHAHNDGTIVITGDFDDLTEIRCGDDSIRHSPQNHWDAFIQHISDTSFYNSTKKYANSLDVKVYPNPTSGLLTISGLTDNFTDIHVFDLLGHKQQLSIQRGPASIFLNLDQLPQGMYVLSMVSGQQRLNKRIMVKR